MTRKRRKAVTRYNRSKDGSRSQRRAEWALNGGNREPWLVFNRRFGGGKTN